MSEKPPLTRRGRFIPSLNSMTDMQKRFAEEYLIDLIPRQAAVRAGYPVEQADRAGKAMMRHTPVREYIGRQMAERSKRTGITADRVLQRLGALVLGDPSAIFNEHGGLKKPGEMDEYDRLMIAGVKTRRAIVQQADGTMAPEEIVEVKTIDQIAAVQLAMRHFGMMHDKVDITVTSSLADRLREAQSRTMGKVIDVEVEETLSADEMQLLGYAAPEGSGDPSDAYPASLQVITEQDGGAAYPSDEIDLDYLMNG